MRSFTNEPGLGVLGWFGAQKKCFGFVAPEAVALISARAHAKASTCRPKASKRREIFSVIVSSVELAIANLSGKPLNASRACKLATNCFLTFFRVIWLGRTERLGIERERASLSG